MISRKQKTRGFTLLELLVVVAIIGLLASYVAPRYFSQVEKSEIKVARAQIDALEKALDQYRLDTGHYPGTEQGLNVYIWGQTRIIISARLRQWPDSLAISPKAYLST